MVVQVGKVRVASGKAIPELWRYDEYGVRFLYARLFVARLNENFTSAQNCLHGSLFFGTTFSISEKRATHSRNYPLNYTTFADFESTSTGNSSLEPLFENVFFSEARFSRFMLL